MELRIVRRALVNQEEIMRSLRAGVVVALVAFFVLVGVALASGYSLFGDAQIVSPGNNSPNAVQLRSSCPSFPSFLCFSNSTFTVGGIDFDIPAGTTFATFATLATDF